MTCPFGINEQSCPGDSGDIRCIGCPSCVITKCEFADIVINTAKELADRLTSRLFHITDTETGIGIISLDDGRDVEVTLRIRTDRYELTENREAPCT